MENEEVTTAADEPETQQPAADQDIVVMGKMSPLN
jgi:hypothetical protein